MSERKPKLKALKACTAWLAACMELGWKKSQLDFLEELWWKYHDDYGNLITGRAAKPGEQTP